MRIRESDRVSGRRARPGALLGLVVFVVLTPLAGSGCVFLRDRDFDYDGELKPEDREAFARKRKDVSGGGISGVLYVDEEVHAFGVVQEAASGKPAARTFKARRESGVLLGSVYGSWDVTTYDGMGRRRFRETETRWFSGLLGSKHETEARDDPPSGEPRSTYGLSLLMGFLGYRKVDDASYLRLFWMDIPVG